MMKRMAGAGEEDGGGCTMEGGDEESGASSLGREVQNLSPSPYFFPPFPSPSSSPIPSPTLRASPSTFSSPSVSPPPSFSPSPHRFHPPSAPSRVQLLHSQH